MQHSKFRQLLSDGERATVDFKIDCGAFAAQTVKANAELAKDVCAMANNGDVASYILVGVSDDGRQFRSVANDKLTDENLQDFCKKAIAPPPKVHLQKVIWNSAAAEFANVEFVVIQIGPQKRLAFRLSQDFIDYGAKVCYRRNEVWIRRGATSDLATPEEIARLVAGHSPTTDEYDQALQAERSRFASSSSQERLRELREGAVAVLAEQGYRELEPESQLRQYLWPGGTISYRTFLKAANGSVAFCYLLGVKASLTQEDLGWATWPHQFRLESAAWELACSLDDVSMPDVQAIRTIAVLVVLAPVSSQRVSKYLPDFRCSSDKKRYYRPPSAISGKAQIGKKPPVPTSTEVIFIDRVKSRTEFVQSLGQAIQDAEADTNAIIL